MSIPRIIHFIWIQGEENIPAKFLPNIESWKYHNPEFEIKIWGTKEIEKLITEHENQDSYSSSLNSLILKQYNHIDVFAIKADIARFVILKVYGGIYIDLDCKCIQSIKNQIPLDPSINTMYFCSPIRSFKYDILKKVYNIFDSSNHDIFFIASSINSPLNTVYLDFLRVEKLKTKTEFIVGLSKVCQTLIKDNTSHLEYNLILLNNKLFVGTENPYNTTIGIHSNEKSWVGNNLDFKFFKLLDTSYLDNILILFTIIISLLLSFILRKSFNLSKKLINILYKSNI